MAGDIRSLFLNGTVGSGKTTTAEALHRILIDDGISSAVVDLDQLRRAWPAPPNDRFNQELVLRNLQAVAGNYRHAGVGRIIVAGVIEHAADVERYRQSLGGRELSLVRLKPTIGTVQKRLRHRHEAGSPDLSWHQDRSVELEGILDKVRLDTHVVELWLRVGVPSPVRDGCSILIMLLVRALTPAGTVL
ncbi:AAA family ATPase [Pseudarthrobacter sp. C4D7]|uniref:AAA family ATPase n=1 Tax=Pseudarthrobacter sp. C4D7 TaxID=2735268 RepID=UPI001C3081E0|nr:adenylyl-sulfate kinase [Pseudarthrobacter sp. C4D7]